MPVTVKIDLNVTHPQQIVIQDASTRQAGVMTKLMAQQLAALVAGGVGTDMQWNVTDVKSADYIAAVGEFVPVDSGEVAINIGLPEATPDNKGMMIAVKGVNQTGTDIQVLADQGIDGADTFVFSGGFVNATYVFVSRGDSWSIAYYYVGNPD